MINVDLAVFAHNEQDRIARTLADLSSQTIFSHEDFSTRLFVLANGCSDDTVAVTRSELSKFENPGVAVVHDLKEGGKSRTWNRFVHEISQEDADILVFIDADIGLPDRSAIKNIVDFLICRKDIVATSSLPLKDIEFYPQDLSLVEKAIANGSKTSGHDLTTAICGQLYAMRSEAARAIKLPIGLPVEDGFIRHAIITSLFSRPEDESLIAQSPEATHVYPSERSIAALLKHQTRIVIGSAVNAALFRYFIRLHRQEGRQRVLNELSASANSPRWLPEKLRKLLPDSRFGWVPWPWLFSRTAAFLKGGPYTVRRTSIAILGFGMDCIVFVNSQFKMARGTGAGHW
ncbi:glycosyltransferase [Bosea sp. ASV33]|uniref:glycosyltransferase n=1 Tax=Bosea sp. ASV33 TaxID=2795106 RepID=UPI0018ED16E5|nr:glycosyltransferase [Bosea sp. ASV33]